MLFSVSIWRTARNHWVIAHVPRTLVCSLWSPVDKKKTSACTRKISRNLYRLEDSAFTVNKTDRCRVEFYQKVSCLLFVSFFLLLPPFISCLAVFLLEQRTPDSAVQRPNRPPGTSSVHASYVRFQAGVVHTRLLRILRAHPPQSDGRCSRTNTPETKRSPVRKFSSRLSLSWVFVKRNSTQR